MQSINHQNKVPGILGLITLTIKMRDLYNVKQMNIAQSRVHNNNNISSILVTSPLL